MPELVKELYDEKNVIYRQMEELKDRVDDWDSEEETKFDRLAARMGEIDSELKSEERRRKVAAFDGLKEHEKDLDRHSQRSEVERDRRDRRGEITTETRLDAFAGYIRASANDSPLPRQRTAMDRMGMQIGSRVLNIPMPTGIIRSLRMFDVNGGNDYEAMHRNLERHKRQLQTDSAGEGQEWVPVEEFIRQVTEIMVQFGPVRGVVRQQSFQDGTNKRFPKSDDTGNRANIVAEGGTEAAVSPVTSDAVIPCFMYRSEVQMSREQMQDTPWNLMSFLTEQLGMRFGRGQSADATVGAGTTEPFGLTVGSGDSGVTFSVGTPDADDLIDLKSSVDPAYRNSPATGFMFDDAGLAYIQKLTDSQGRYQSIWQPGLVPGAPNTILGFNYTINQDMPSPTGTNRAFLFGDFSRAIFCDVGSLSIQILDQLYANNLRVGILGWLRTGFGVIDDTAIKYATMAV